MADKKITSAYLKSTLTWSTELRGERPPLTLTTAHSQCVTALRDDLGLGEARAIARRLVDHIIGIDNAHLLAPDTPLDDIQWIDFESALHALKNGTPLPYILGSIEFCGLDFRCDDRALIPRPETELLVETALHHLRHIPGPRIADLGTGTGCIAISCAHAREDLTAYATDVSDLTRDLARENAQALGVTEKVKFLPGLANDWTAPIAPHAPFDAILSNPPYIPAGEIESLERHVLREPRRALDGGEDGLDPYRALAAGCRTLLKSTGFLACELGAGQFGDVRALFETHGWTVADPILDFAGHQRVLLATP